MKKSSFLEGTIISTLAIFIVKILGMIYVIPFCAMVGAKGSALYAYAYNIYVIFLDISTAGLPIAISKIINEFDTLEMYEAKERTYKIGKRILGIIAIVVFTILFIFAPYISSLLLGDLKGGNTIADVTLSIRCVSFALLVVPFLSVAKGYLQGHKIYNVSSNSQIIEQVVRISIILGGCYLLLKVFHTSVTIAICLSVGAAFIAALVSYIYVLFKVKKYNKENVVDLTKKDDITNKEIIKKIISYAIPFIIINTVASIYNFIDMVIILRVTNYLGISASNVEFITSAITTWSGKICMIVTSIAMGMTISLIPTIVSAYTKKDFNEVNDKLNQALQVILLTSLPMSIGLILLSKPVWSVFYGYNTIGSQILSIVLIVNLVGNIYMITSSTLQSLNKFKLVYKCSIIGLLLNAILDAPLMLLFNKINIPPYLGASVASIIGYTTSSLIALISLKKEYNLHYGKTYKLLLKLIIPLILMSTSVLLITNFIPINYQSKISCIITIAISSIVGGLIYILYLHKLGIIKKVFGDALYNKIMNIITFGKYAKKHKEEA